MSLLRIHNLLLFVVCTSLPFPELHGIYVFLAATVEPLGFLSVMQFFCFLFQTKFDF